MATASSSTNVCMDTCVFVNFAIVGRVDVIAKISGLLFHVPQEVVDEVTVATQRQLLDEILASGGLKKTELTCDGGGHVMRCEADVGKTVGHLLSLSEVNAAAAGGSK